MKPLKQLPISQAQSLIETSIRENAVTFIGTPTGSGKTMLCPYWAFMLTGKQVFCTVPRVKLAQEAALGVATIWGKPLAGYATGQRDENVSRPVVYVTEGSFIMRNLAASLVAGQVLCIDEVHEQGADLEALLFKAKELAARGVKIVLMSATLDINKYTKMYEGLSVGVVQLPPAERPYSTEIVINPNPVQAVCDAANAGGRVLVGLAGKEDIEQFIGQLERLKCTAKIFPIHGEIELDTQGVALRYTGACVYVCTNVVQSGLTIFGLTHGYFSGKGKRIEVRNGENALVEYNLSVAEMTQWRGRLGRTCPGTIIVPNETERDLLGREAMPTAEILRSNLDETILSFAVMGLRLQDCTLLNMPSKEAINTSLATLISLGLADLDGTVNAYGLKVAKCGEGLRGGIAIIKGKELGIENTAKKLAAVSSMRSFLSFDKIQTPMSFIKTILGAEYEGVKHSDHMIIVKVVEYFAGKYGKETSKGLRVDPSMLGQFIEECTANFIFRRSLEQLIFVFGRINKKCSNAKPLTIEAANGVLRSMYADQILKLSYGSLEDSKGYTRKVSDNNKAVRTSQTEAVGNLVSIQTRGDILRLVEMVTYLNSLPVTTTTPPTFDGESKEVVTITETKVNGVVVESSKEVCAFSKEVAQILLNNLYRIPGVAEVNAANREVAAKINALHIQSAGMVQEVNYTEWMLSRLVELQAVGMVELLADIDYLTLKLEDFVSSDDAEYIGLAAPKEVSGFPLEYKKDNGNFFAVLTIDAWDGVQSLPTTLEMGQRIVFRWNGYFLNTIEEVIQKKGEAIEREFASLQRDTTSFSGFNNAVLAEPKPWAGGIAYMGIVHRYSDYFETRWFKTEEEAKESIETAKAAQSEYDAKGKADAVYRWNRYESIDDCSETLPTSEVEEISYMGYTLYVGWVAVVRYLEVMYYKQARGSKEEFEASLDASELQKYKELNVLISDFQYCEDREAVETFAFNNGKRGVLRDIQSLTDRARNLCLDMDAEAFKLFDKAKALYAGIEKAYMEDRIANNPFAAAFAKLKK